MISNLIRLDYISEIIENLWIDLSIQRRFCGGGAIISIDGRNIIHNTVNAKYSVINDIFFKYFSIQEKDVIVDVGCGKGRVFSYLLYKGMKNRMIGYEINQLVGLKTKKHLSKYKNVEITAENIFDNFPVDSNVFYIYNPFNGPMMEEFKESIWKIKQNNPVILYLNPECIDSFNDTRFVNEIVEIPHKTWSYNFAIIKIANCR
jgi:SAM-dependent methyltransferase